jgi:hypothetical protein
MSNYKKMIRCGCASLALAAALAGSQAMAQSTLPPEDIGETPATAAAEA